MTMPEGKYYVGDLCYVIKSDDEVCDFNCNDSPDGEFVLSDGRRFASYSAAYGDGIYQDQLGNRYGVDSGTIGCIRMDDIPDILESEVTDLGAVIDFPDDFETGKRNGAIYIGHVVIDTASYDDDDY